MDEMNSADNLRSVVNRLPFHLKMKWLEVADKIQESGQRPRIHHVSQFVCAKDRAANNPVFGDDFNNERERTKREGFKTKTKSPSTKVTTRGDLRKPGPATVQGERAQSNRRVPSGFKSSAVFGRCIVCDGIHHTRCIFQTQQQFNNKPYSDRINIIRDARLCENCFKVGHMAKGCMQRSGCYVEGCGKQHMTILHPPAQLLPTGQETQNGHPTREEVGSNEMSRAGVNTDQPSQDHATGAGVNSQSSTSHTTNQVRLRIVPVGVRGSQPGQVVETYALLDNGSDVTLCDRMLVEQLGITGKPRNFFLTTQERKDSEKSGLEVKLTIDSIYEDSTIQVPMAWTVDHLNISECSIPRDHDVDKWPHLNGIDLPEIDNKEVRVLIGCNVPEAFWVLEERRGGRGEPVAIRSLLGWTLIGPTEKVKEESSSNVKFVRLECERERGDEALLQKVKNF